MPLRAQHKAPTRLPRVAAERRRSEVVTSNNPKYNDISFFSLCFSYGVDPREEGGEAGRPAIISIIIKSPHRDPTADSLSRCIGQSQRYGPRKEHPKIKS